MNKDDYNGYVQDCMNGHAAIYAKPVNVKMRRTLSAAGMARQRAAGIKAGKVSAARARARHAECLGDEVRKEQRACFERMAWFVRQLVAGKPVNQSVVAERFEVHKRTAQRDVEFVRDRWGIAMVWDGSGNCYRLVGRFACPLCRRDGPNGRDGRES